VHPLRAMIDATIIAKAFSPLIILTHSTGTGIALRH
jgi:hypothetical protein